MKLDIELAKSEYQAEVNRLIEEYGGPSNVPEDDRRIASEKLRASYSIHANPEVPVPQVLKSYSIDSRVWHHFVDDLTQVKTERRMSRADKINAVIKWAADNVGKKVDLTELMSVGDIAYSMAKKITEDRPDIFWKIKRGQFEVRDPKADREADKKAAEKIEEEKEKASDAQDN